MLLRRWFDLMMANQEDLARLMTLEQGKPLAESRGEVAYGASFIEWFAEEGKRIYGDTIPAPRPRQAHHRHQAADRRGRGASRRGTFPIAMITRKVGPALAAGCTVVVKPASQTPFSALALAELAERAGIPPGVFNVVTGSAGGDRRRADRNPIVRKISFTGSTEVGKVLMAQCAATVKKSVARARRQRAVHRVRRRRPGCGGRRRDRLEIPQHRPDLRLRQPPAGAGRRSTTRSPRSWRQRSAS